MCLVYSYFVSRYILVVRLLVFVFVFVFVFVGFLFGFGVHRGTQG